VDRQTDKIGLGSAPDRAAANLELEIETAGFIGRRDQKPNASVLSAGVGAWSPSNHQNNFRSLKFPFRGAFCCLGEDSTSGGGNRLIGAPCDILLNQGNENETGRQARRLQSSQTSSPHRHLNKRTVMPRRVSSMTITRRSSEAHAGH
jgi:hypothetical protein